MNNNVYLCSRKMSIALAYANNTLRKSNLTFNGEEVSLPFLSVFYRAGLARRLKRKKYITHYY